MLGTVWVLSFSAETLTALRQFAIALREQRRNFDECERLFKNDELVVITALPEATPPLELIVMSPSGPSQTVAGGCGRTRRIVS